jgi:hypothetical protein
VQRLLIVIALQLVIALLSLLNLGAFSLDHLLEPKRPVTTFALYASAGVIAIVTFGIIATAIGNREKAIPLSWLAAALGVTVIAGFVPRLVDANLRENEIAERRVDDRRFEQDFLRDLAGWQRDIAARIPAHRAFTPEQALDFILLVDQSDLRYRGLPDHSEAAFALLQDALKAGIIDPNGRIDGERYKNLSGQPIFLYYYEIRVIHREAGPREWKLLELLIEAGADLTLAEAKPLVADLAKRHATGH